MPSLYTDNLGIEKPAPGEQIGSWGGTNNTNFDLYDQAIVGITSITLVAPGTSGSPNDLPITDGALSEGRNKFIEITDGGDLLADVYVQLTPNNSEKIVYIKNSLTNQDLYVFQGTWDAARDYVILNGNTALVKFSGGGATATVTAVYQNLQCDGTLRLGGALTVVGAISGSNLSGTNTGDETAATTSAQGIVELATQAEVDAGTDTGRVVTPETLAAYSGLAPSVLTTKGDVYGYDTAAARVPIGTDTHVLTADSAQALGLKWAAATPLTTKGDVLGFSTVLARLGVGSDGQVLTAASGQATGLEWTTIASGGLGNVVEDTTPELGGDLDGNNNEIRLTNTGVAQGIKFYEPSGGGSSYAQIRAQSMGSSYTLTLPTTDGASGEYLKTNGTGGLSWDTPAGGSGTVTSVGTNTGLSGTVTTSGNLSLDLPAIALGGTLVAGDWLIADNGGVQNRQLISSIPLSIFNNDSSWTSNAGTVTSVTGGTNLNGTVTSSGSLNLDAAITGMTSVYGTGLKVGDNSTDYMSFSATGQVDVVVGSTVEFRFEADGDFHADGDVISASTTVGSDRKLKENLTPIDFGLDKVFNLNGYTYNLKKSGKRKAGLIAQDVEKVLPEAVSTETNIATGEEYLALDYNAVVALLVECVKDLQDQVDALKSAL
jgi:hypothetical protein